MNGVRGAVRDPFVVSVALLVAIVACGFAALALAWRGATGTSVAGEQVPFAVSGGLGGLGLVGFGAGVLEIQLRRRAAASRLGALDRAITAAAGALAAAEARTGTGGH